MPGRGCWRAATLVLLLATPTAAHAQGQWRHPYPEEAPDYWELVGRLFPETMALAQDPELKPITDPAGLAFGTVRPRAGAGDTIASFAMVTYNGSPENLSQLEKPRLVIKDLTQVRLIIAGRLGVMVELRTASSSEGHMECFYAALRRSAFLLDGLARAAGACDRGATWSPWQRQPERLPFTGSFVLDGSTVLEFSADPTTQEITTSVRTRLASDVTRPMGVQ